MKVLQENGNSVHKRIDALEEFLGANNMTIERAYNGLIINIDGRQYQPMDMEDHEPIDVLPRMFDHEKFARVD